jgi:hypothetical protein
MPIAFYRLLLPEKGKPTPEMLGCWVRVFEQERIASDLSGKNPNCGPLAHSLPCHKWEGSLMTQSRLRSSAAKTFAICPNADLLVKLLWVAESSPATTVGSPAWP